jgi:hypothetical protein
VGPNPTEPEPLVVLKLDTHGKELKLTQLEQQTESRLDPYTIFVYALRSSYTKETYFRRLRTLFDFIDLNPGTMVTTIYLKLVY